MNQEDNPRREEFSTAINLVNASLPKGKVVDTSPTSKHKKMTKKGIQKNLEKMDMRINKLNNSIKGIDHLFGRVIYDLDEWRDDKSEFPTRIISRKDEVGPKLSESAFGAD
jgi:hypothetical protein